MKKILLLLIVIVAVAGGLYYWKYRRTNSDENASKTKTVKVEHGKIFSVVDTTGKIVSELDVEIKCKASGQVVKLPFNISDMVKKNDLLVELDPIDEQRLEKQAEITLAASNAKLIQARQNLLIAETRLVIEKKKADTNLKSAEARAAESNSKLKRIRDLLQNNLASQHDYETAQAAYADASSALDRARISVEELQLEGMGLEVKRQDIKLAEAQVASDEIDLSKAMQRRSDTKVLSPIEGIISERKIQIGQIISSGISNVGGGTTILTISDLSRVFVLASVDESDIGQVYPGHPAVITTDAFLQRHFPGQVVLISTKGLSTANVVTFEVKIEVLGESKFLLKPEMTANIKIVTAQRDNVLLIPSEAIYHKGIDRDILSKLDFTKEFSRLQKRIARLSADSANEKDGQRDSSSENKENPTLRENPKDDATSDNEVAMKLPADNEKEDGKAAQRRKRGMSKDGKDGKEKASPRYNPKKNFVLVQKQGKTEEREVEIGINDGIKAEIISGLEEGDEVVIEKGHAQSRWQNMSGRESRMMMGRVPH